MTEIYIWGRILWMNVILILISPKFVHKVPFENKSALTFTICHHWVRYRRKTINSLRPRQNRRHFADDILKCVFLNENEWISLRISLKFVSKVRINNIPSLFQIMAWCRPGDKPLSEPMMISLLTHICVTRPQWVDCTNDYPVRWWIYIHVISHLNVDPCSQAILANIGLILF